jgi:hypothetical protein
VRCLGDSHPAVAEESESSLFMLAQEHPEAVAVVRNRARERTGTVVVVLADPPPGPLRRPAWVSRIDARSHTTWRIHATQPDHALDRATLIPIDTLELREGDSGRAEVCPDDWSRWEHVRIGDQIELHTPPYGLVAIGSVLAITPPRR